jgi:ABC-2 type transport system permease protein/oleandomycin transport system permease protein
MTAVSAPIAERVVRGGSPGAGAGRAVWAVRDAVTVTWRNLLGYLRIPEALFFSSVQPIMFVLLFRYVFGGAIHPPGVSYVNYLIPGIFVQTVSFGAVGTTIGLAEDLHKGLVERFRALPMARSAVLAGRTSADLVRNVLVVALITGVGYLVGFRAQTSVAAFLAGIGLLLVFAYALSWGFAVIGLKAPNSETAQVMAFPLLFPLTFASSAFVPVSQMPSWLRVFANNQPFSLVVNSTRALMIGGPTASYVGRALLWCAGLLLVLVPLAVRVYRRME